MSRAVSRSWWEVAAAAARHQLLWRSNPSLTTRSGAVNDHDRSIARDELEALVITEGDEPGQ